MTAPTTIRADLERRVLTALAAIPVGGCERVETSLVTRIATETYRVNGRRVSPDVAASMVAHEAISGRAAR